MADTPNYDIQVIGPDDYAVMIMVDRDGHTSLRSTAEPRYVGELLSVLTARFHQNQGLPLHIGDDLTTALTAAGWTPPNT